MVGIDNNVIRRWVIVRNVIPVLRNKQKKYLNKWTMDDNTIVMVVMGDSGSGMSSKGIRRALEYDKEIKFFTKEEFLKHNKTGGER